MLSSDHDTELDSQELFHDISRCAVIQDYFRNQAHLTGLEPSSDTAASQRYGTPTAGALARRHRRGTNFIRQLEPSIGEDRNAIGASSADEVWNSYANAFNDPRMMVAAKIP